MTAPVPPTPAKTSTVWTKVTEIGTAFAALTPAFKGLLILAIAAVAYFGFQSYSAKSDLTKFNDNYTAYKKEAASTIKYVQDSTAKEVAAHQKVAQQALGQVTQIQTKIDVLTKTMPSKDTLASLKRQIDSLKAAKDSVVLARTVIPKQDTLIADQQTTIAKKDTAISYYVKQTALLQFAHANDTTIIRIQGVAIDTLKYRLTHLPKAPVTKILGIIPIPDRKSAAALGFLVGVFATIEVAIHVK
jgi:hypothetical protein